MGICPAHNLSAGLVRSLESHGRKSEPFELENRLISMRTDNSARRAYRIAFGEYAGKLGALQRLIESGGPDNGRLEAAMQDVERARQAHNSARDLLAAELAMKSSRRTESASR